MYKFHKFCRACDYGHGDTEKLVMVADFGFRPLANDFRNETEEHAGAAPLQVLFCPRCKLAQLSVVVDPKILYRNYPYVTSNTTMMIEHFDVIWRQMSERLGTIDSVIEIGSNDGLFLKHCLKLGSCAVTGIEPDAALASAARQSGVPTLCGFWPEIELDLHYDLIVARHVFCHVDDWFGFVKKAGECMHDRSILFIEAPYALDLLEKNQADTIYHEHLSYLNIEAVQALVKRVGMMLTDVIHYDLHGGCLGLVIQKTGKPYEVNPEDLFPQRWRWLVNATNEACRNLHNQVLEYRSQGKTIYGYGASAKSSFWIQSCGFSRETIRLITDDTPAKWFRFSPGTDIPITDESAMVFSPPDYAILFAWNYEKEVLVRQKKFIENGGKFIVPIPSVHVVP